MLIDLRSDTVTRPSLAMKEAMMKEIAFRYTNRGDEVTAALCVQAINLASPFKEVGTWLG